MRIQVERQSTTGNYMFVTFNNISDFWKEDAYLSLDRKNSFAIGLRCSGKVKHIYGFTDVRIRNQIFRQITNARAADKDVRIARRYFRKQVFSQAQAKEIVKKEMRYSLKYLTYAFSKAERLSRKSKTELDAYNCYVAQHLQDIFRGQQVSPKHILEASRIWGATLYIPRKVIEVKVTPEQFFHALI